MSTCDFICKTIVASLSCLIWRGALTQKTSVFNGQTFFCPLEAKYDVPIIINSLKTKQKTTNALCVQYMLHLIIYKIISRFINYQKSFHRAGLSLIIDISIQMVNFLVKKPSNILM